MINFAIDLGTTNSLIAKFNHGAVEVFVAATHGVFAGPAVERLAEADLNEIVVTDTISIRPEVGKRLSNLTVLSEADLIGEAIRRIHEHRSVSALFY